MNIIENKNYCNEIIHNELRNNDILCPFCNLQINENQSNKTITCCDKQHLVNDKGLICYNCGIRFNYEFVAPYFDFHKNNFMIKQKTIYNRQYHIQNIINNYKQQQIPCEIRYKIYNFFKKIDLINEILNNHFNRKRIISIHYILRCILKVLDQPFEFITLSNHMKTTNFFKQYWKYIYKLIGKDINNIINK